MSSKVLVYSKDKVIAFAITEVLNDLPDVSEVLCTLSGEEVYDLAKQYDAFVIDEDYALHNMLCNFDKASLLLLEQGKYENCDSCEDIVYKPFKFMTLADYLCRKLLRYNNHTDKEIQIGKIKFFPIQRQLVLQEGKTSVFLTEKETEILLCLSHNIGCVVDKDTLLKEVWGYNSEITTHTLETHIYRLRHKMGQLNEKEIICSVDGGYCINF